MQNNTVVIVHGWEGGPNTHWMPWLTKQLAELHISVSSPQFPTDNIPTLESWIEVLRRETINENTILVGHSLGVITILRLLEEHGGAPVAGVISVAGFARDIRIPELNDFLLTPVDFAKVRTQALGFRVLQSSDDRDVPLVEAEMLALGLHAPLITLHRHGHFTASDGVTKCEPILDAVLSLTRE